jgi:hypothetical protein
MAPSPLAGEGGVRGHGLSRDLYSRIETPHPDFPLAREIRPLPQGERREFAAPGSRDLTGTEGGSRRQASSSELCATGAAGIGTVLNRDGRLTGR